MGQAWAGGAHAVKVAVPLNSASVNTGFAQARLTASKSIPVITNHLYIERKIFFLFFCKLFEAHSFEKSKHQGQNIGNTETLRDP